MSARRSSPYTALLRLLQSSKVAHRPPSARWSVLLGVSLLTLCASVAGAVVFVITGASSASAYHGPLGARADSGPTGPLAPTGASVSTGSSPTTSVGAPTGASSGDSTLPTTSTVGPTGATSATSTLPTDSLPSTAVGTMPVVVSTTTTIPSWAPSSADASTRNVAAAPSPTVTESCSPEVIEVSTPETETQDGHSVVVMVSHLVTREHLVTVVQKTDVDGAPATTVTSEEEPLTLCRKIVGR